MIKFSSSVDKEGKKIYEDDEILIIMIITIMNLECLQLFFLQQSMTIQVSDNPDYQDSDSQFSMIITIVMILPVRC